MWKVKPFWALTSCCVVVVVDLVFGGCLSLDMQARIGIAQIIVLGATAFVIFWYTLETQRIREETSRTNAIMQEQLSWMKKVNADEARKEDSASDPILVFTYGEWGATEVQFAMINKGAPIKDISVKELGIFRVTISRSEHLGSNEVINFKLQGSNLIGQDVLNIALEFTDTFGRHRNQIFQVLPSRQTVHRLKDLGAF